MLELYEHSSKMLQPLHGANWSGLPIKYFAGKRENGPCFIIEPKDERICISANYYVGLDWLMPGSEVIYVAPKINQQAITSFTVATNDEPGTGLQPDNYSANQCYELDILQMLNECMNDPFIAAETGCLLQIDWEAPEIRVPHEQDHLSPFMILRFLHLLRQIVRKGLKKSYTRNEENLDSRVKGKIMVGRNIRENTLRNRPTFTYCSFEIFSEDTPENRALKNALTFSSSFIDSNPAIFGSSINGLQQLVNYCRPAFYKIGTDVDWSRLMALPPNPFFREYREALKLGNGILRRYSYSIAKTCQSQLSTPPYWIDMPKLFELYVYGLLKQIFPANKTVQYQFSTYGNALDFLLNSQKYKMVIDAKYKLAYSARVIHDDIRQVSGYARLEKVYKELNINSTELIDCLIVYPDITNGTSKQGFKLDLALPIPSYRGVYKLGIKLPIK